MNRGESPPLGMYRTEEEGAERRFNFVVRANPRPVPEALVTEEPLHCLKINALWVGHLLGAIEALNQPDSWAGSDAQQWAALQQVEYLANMLKEVCNEMGVIFRQSGCNLEMSNDNGATWTSIYDISSCIPEIPEIPEIPPVAQFQQVDCTLEANTGGGFVTIFDASCAKNDEHIDFPDRPIDGIGTDKVCDFATYMTELSLPTQLQQIIVAKEQALNNVQLAAALLAMPAAIIAAIPTGGVAIAAWVAAIAAGGAAGAAGLTVYSAVEEMNIENTEGEVTPQFWQDVKCVIYCNMPIDARLTKEAAQTIGEKIIEDLAGTYPNAAPVVASFFYSYTSEARAALTAYGALWDGVGCGLCGCDDAWIYAPLAGNIAEVCRPSEYIKVLAGQLTAPEDQVFKPAATAVYLFLSEPINPGCSAYGEVEIDLRQFNLELTDWQAVRDTRVSGGTSCQSQARTSRVYSWNESTEEWILEYEGTANNFDSNTKVAFSNPTRRVRFYCEGDDRPGYYRRMTLLRLYGKRFNPFAVECS